MNFSVYFVAALTSSISTTDLQFLHQNSSNYKMKIVVINFLLLLGLTSGLFGQSTSSVEDDFEGNGTIEAWIGQFCSVDTNFPNPFQDASNSSTTVLSYHDTGGDYANVRFEVDNNFDLQTNHTFTLKIYVPSDAITGSQPNQISLKLQNGTLAEPWTTQSEIIKPIVLDQWQTVSFDFGADPYINLNPDSAPPTQRTDFNRVLLQVNGEDNTDQVLAYIDDMYYDGTVTASNDPVYDYLVWSDEFDEDGALDSDKWFHQTQLPSGGSWYNGEVQHYTDRLENSYVENGIMKIVAQRETFTDQGHTKNFTSARLNSKFAFTYGKVEVRAKLPSGFGTWPAIWMLGKNINEAGAYWQTQGFGTTGWPACGEIDIMEHWGSNQNYVQSAMHTPSSFGGTVNKGGQLVPTVSSEFHVYTLEWFPNKMVFSVDDVVHYIYEPAVRNADTWPFDAEQYLLLNIAIESQIAGSFTSGAMEVDYVRIYQENTVSTNPIVDDATFRLYPNPVDDVLNLELGNSDAQHGVARIYSIDGKLVLTRSLPITDQRITIDSLSQLKAGTYLLEMEMAGRTKSMKFVKN